MLFRSCKGHGHLKKECLNYLQGKGKVYATTLSDSDSSNSDSEKSCDGEGNYSTFMTIAPMESSDDLSVLVEKLSEHTKVELMEIVEESDDEEDERTMGLQETYNTLLEKTGEYARVARAAIKKMKRAEQNYNSLLVRYKETKCEVETLNGKLTEAYSKIKFLELEVIQANAKVEHVSSKKLDKVLAHQKPFSNKSGLGYTGEASLSTIVSKEMKFVKAKEPVVTTLAVEKEKFEKKPKVIAQQVSTKPPNPVVAKLKAKGKSLPKSQRESQTQHFCHHCGIRGHTRPNCYKLWALKNGSSQRPSGQRNGKGNLKQSKGGEADSNIGDMMKMIDTITSCLANFTLRFENCNSSTQSSKDITPNARAVWVKKGTHA